MITGAYNELTYTIFRDGREVYNAGNSHHDSQTVVAAAEGVGLRQMRSFCRITARALAAELGIPYGGVKRQRSDEHASNL